MGEGSSMEKKENIQRHQKGIGKWYNQRRASSALQLHERGGVEQWQEMKLEWESGSWWQKHLNVILVLDYMLKVMEGHKRIWSKNEILTETLKL